MQQNSRFPKKWAQQNINILPMSAVGNGMALNDIVTIIMLLRDKHTLAFWGVIWYDLKWFDLIQIVCFFWFYKIWYDLICYDYIRFAMIFQWDLGFNIIWQDSKWFGLQKMPSEVGKYFKNCEYLERTLLCVNDI